MTFRPLRAPALATLVALACVLALWARSARASDPAFQGDWTLSAVSETFTVQQWAGPCGPPPVSRTIQPAGPATVANEEGELVVTSATRSFRSDQCLDPLATLIREAHSADGHTWRTRCATPVGDPRRAVVNSAFFLTGGDLVSIAETGRYEFQIEGSRCVADVSRQASARRRPGAPDGEPAAHASTAARGTSIDPAVVRKGDDTRARAAPSKVDCNRPGEPARLEVRPSRKLLRLGDEFRFHATVVDDNGCPTGTPVRWTLGPVHTKAGDGATFQPTIDNGGGLVVPAGHGSDATFDVIATAAERSARASVEVTSDAAYEALLAESGLDPNGERDEPAVAMLATTSINAVSVLAEDSARHRRMLFVGVIGSLVALLSAVAIFAALRSRRARALEQAVKARHADQMRAYEELKRHREQSHAAQMRAHLESVAQAQQVIGSAAAAMASGAALGGTAVGVMFCPACRREYSTGVGFCPHDANRLIAVRNHESVAPGPMGGVCPTCRRGYNPGIRVCPHDGDELVPATLVALPPAAPSRGKICPTCGARFEGISAFCSQDGTQLVLLN